MSRRRTSSTHLRSDRGTVPSARLAGHDDVGALPRRFAVGHPGDGLRYVESVVPATRTVGALLGGEVIVERAATPTRLLHKVLPVADVLHVTCHGACDPVSPLLSCLLLEPDTQHPDGRLMFYEILGVPVRATVLSLGACQTAKSDGPVSFPESLAHALLGAGARFVLASLWDADPEECAAFHHEFYLALREDQDPVTAFKRAQQTQIEAWQALRDRGDGPTCDEALAKRANFVLLSARSTSAG